MKLWCQSCHQEIPTIPNPAAVGRHGVPKHLCSRCGGEIALTSKPRPGGSPPGAPYIDRFQASREMSGERD